jgi:LCP family protein required for cell wall assembly
MSDETPDVPGTDPSKGPVIGDSTPVAPAGPRRGRRRGIRWGRIVIITAAVLFAVVASAVAYFGLRVNAAVDSIDQDPSALPTGSRPPSATPSVKTTYTAMNILLIGSDSRKGERGLSDTFIIAHISADRKSVYLVSFPRDMYVSIPGYGKEKINAAYSYGGSAKSVETIESLTGARIDHVVVTNFENFVGLVNKVGPITVDNPVASSPIRADSRGVKYAQFGKTGPVTLVDGNMALAFVRERENLPKGDLDRTLRQRAFLKALALKLVTPEVLANPVKLLDIISMAGQYVTTRDSQLTSEVIYPLVASMTGITNGDQIHLVQCPIGSFQTIPGVGDVEIVDMAGTTALGKALQNDTMPAFVAAHPLTEFGYQPSAAPSASPSATPTKKKS